MKRSNAFVAFVGNFSYNHDTRKVENKYAIDLAINSISKNDLMKVKSDLSDLLTGSYSDDEIVQICYDCQPRFVYKGKAQRELLHEAYDAILIALANSKRSFFSKDVKE
jgi:hypothetical protein